jgi:hypothetical protein
MTQNTSHAVMAQRREPQDGLDDFPTPMWATRALIEHVLKPLDLALPGHIVAEPAAGRGYMARALAEYFDTVWASDIHQYVEGAAVSDFLTDPCGPTPDGSGAADWIITNPPFRLFTEFVERAAHLARYGVAMFGRIQILETVNRYNRIFQPWYGRLLWCQYVERVPLLQGRLERKASSASAYGWLVIAKHCYFPHPYVSTWSPGRTFPVVLIPPCRKELERDSDYDRGDNTDSSRPPAAAE